MCDKFPTSVYQNIKSQLEKFKLDMSVDVSKM